MATKTRFYVTVEEWNSLAPIITGDLMEVRIKDASSLELWLDLEFVGRSDTLKTREVPVMKLWQVEWQVFKAPNGANSDSRKYFAKEKNATVFAEDLIKAAAMTGSGVTPKVSVITTEDD